MNSLRKTFFHSFVLAGLALSPLYGVLSEAPNFFLVHNSGPNDFVMLIAMVSFVFPLVIASGVTLTLKMFSRQKVLGARVFIALLAALVLFPFVKNMMGENVLGTFIVAALLGMAFSFVYGKFLGPKLFLNYISPAILVLPALFLFEPKIFVLAVPEISEADYPVVSIPSDTPVVFILFDEFPLSSILNEDLMIDKQAFPNFERLASKSHWFRNASTNYAYTGHAIRSVFTGARQGNARIGTYKYYPNNLFTLLGHDYQVEAHESALRLCPPHICIDEQEAKGLEKITMFWKDVGAVYLNLILPQARRFGVPGVSQGYKNFWSRKVGEDTVPGAQIDLVRKEFKIPIFDPGFEAREIEGREDIFENFLNGFSSTPKKKFYFLHILFPHQPYRFLSSGQKYDLAGEFDSLGLDEKKAKGGMWGKEEWLINIQYQKLMNQVGYTDSLLGKLLDRLEGSDLLNKALFILAADHGVNIRAGGFRREPRGESVSDIASLPLFIKLPDQNKRVVSDLPATLLDILPTLADVLDVKVPWAIAGHSLFEFPSREQGRVIYDYELEAYPIPENVKKPLMAAVKRKRDLFGKFEGWGKFRLQDEKSQFFMDKPVSEFQAQAIESVQVKLDLGSRVEARPGFLPAIVQGRITGIKNRTEWSTLIAVNGVFRAVSPIVKINDYEKILAFLPEVAFKEGGNVVEVYVIRKTWVKGGDIFKPVLN